MGEFHNRYGRRVDHLPDWCVDHFGRVLQWLGCQIWGHVPVPDQCGIPEHDFCAWCLRSMPNAWPRRVAEQDTPP